MTLVYHHTDSARLPWILKDQALKPGSNRVGNFPDDFLWATIDPRGDLSSSGAAQREAYVEGKVAQVRFTLDDDDFTPWDRMKASHPRWQAHHIAILERSALQMGVAHKQIDQWRCRIEPLASTRWIAVEYRTWRNKHWRAAPRSVHVQASGEALGVQLDGYVFYSRQRVSDDRPTAYEVGRMLA